MAREIKPIVHVNMISGTENSHQSEIYCRAKNGLMSYNIPKCEKCPMFRGFGQGDVVMCEWEDVAPNGGYGTRVIPHAEHQQEMFRVAELIDAGIIKKG